MLTDGTVVESCEKKQTKPVPKPISKPITENSTPVPQKES